MKLINGEALEQLRLIPTKSIDFVCIDPPYELDNHGGGKTDFAQRKLVKDLHIDFISNGFDIEQIFAEIQRVSKTMNMVCFCSNKQVSKIMNYWEQKKYSVTLLVWQKSNPVPFGNGKYISDLEFMIYVRGKNAIYNNTGYANQLKTYNYPAPSSKTRIHPTEKPIELLKRLIDIHSNIGSVVLDCFGGSFSTGLACMELEREFIGIEIDTEIFNSAKNRAEEKRKEKEFTVVTSFGDGM
jgi:site-specific DNA-methyltransferase (adenine-specific)